MRIIQFFKKHRKSTDILLLVLFIGNIVLLGDIIASSFTKDFVIDVIENKNNLPVVKNEDYIIEHREVHSTIKFRSEKLLDFLFINKTSAPNPILFLFTASVIFQLMRIKSLWYHQYFTQRLYANIDALGLLAVVMFIFNRIHEYYLKNLVEEMSKGKLIADIDSNFIAITAVVMILSAVLKSFAKQGNKIQQEQELTI